MVGISILLKGHMMTGTRSVVTKAWAEAHEDDSCKKNFKKIKKSKKKNALNSELCASPGSLANWKASNSQTCSSSQNTHRLAAVMQQLVQRNQLGTNTKTSTLT